MSASVTGGLLVAMTGTADYLDFIDASPSSYHAAAEVASRLAAAGFHRQDEKETWDASPGGHYIVRGGAVLAWRVPEGTADRFRIVGSHTDSPGLKLKPVGDIVGPGGWRQAAVEVYGGAILPAWLDRELRLAGRVVLADGSEHLVRTAPVLRVPHLAIHLDRSVNSGFTLDRQQHMQPVFAVGDGSPTIGEVVAGALDVPDVPDVHADDILAHDLITVDAQRGEVFGARGDFIAAGRMDNLSSVFTSLEAFLSAEDVDGVVPVLAAFDHEEVGSATTSGAAGPVLEDVLTRTATALGADVEGTRAMFARSSCVSADAAHSVHPNYAGKHDAVNRPVVNGGPVLKVNANQRYASDAATSAAWRAACRAAGAPDQVFAGHNDVPCGSTIGPITATRLGIPTVDVGIPLLSMHSAREMAGVHDLTWFTDTLKAWWEQ